jgi:hypothetical protein
MRSFFYVISIIIRLLIIYKVFVLLFTTATSVDEESFKKLIWWGVFLIFDIWLQQSFPFDNNDKED